MEKKRKIKRPKGRVTRTCHECKRNYLVAAKGAHFSKYCGNDCRNTVKRRVYAANKENGKMKQTEDPKPKAKPDVVDIIALFDMVIELNMSKREWQMFCRMVADHYKAKGL